jgi:hypothetical protein
LFATEKLLKKRIFGEEITAQKLFDAIKGFQKILNSSDVPSGRSMYRYRSFATVHLDNLISSLFEEYKNLIEEKSKTIKSVDELEMAHGLAVNNLKIEFDKTKKIGDEKLHQKYYKKLINETNEFYDITLQIISANIEMDEKEGTRKRNKKTRSF